MDYAEMQLQGANALYAALHEERPYHDGSFTDWSKERTSRHPFHHSDGVHIVLAAEDLNPDDDFLTNERAEPTKPHSPSDSSKSPA